MEMKKRCADRTSRERQHTAQDSHTTGCEGHTPQGAPNQDRQAAGKTTHRGLLSSLEGSVTFMAHNGDYPEVLHFFLQKNPTNKA